MIRRLAHLWHHHRAATLAFGLIAALTLVLLIRAALFTLYWSDPAHRDPKLQGWMTPRYVAHAWQVPPEVVRAALGDAPLPGPRQSLDAIAQDRGVDPAALIAAIEASLDAHRAAGRSGP